MERSVILLDNQHIDSLVRNARAARVTVSWILRCLYFQHRDLAIQARPMRPLGALPTHSSPFPLCWHGDRAAIQNYLYVHGLELSAVMRYLVSLYLSGDLAVDLRSERLVKREYVPDLTKTRVKNLPHRYRYLHQYKTWRFRDEDYWPINHESLIWMMEAGLANRRKPRKYGPIFSS